MVRRMCRVIVCVGMVLAGTSAGCGWLGDDMDPEPTSTAEARPRPSVAVATDAPPEAGDGLPGKGEKLPEAGADTIGLILISLGMMVSGWGMRRLVLNF